MEQELSRPVLVEKSIIDKEAVDLGTAEKSVAPIAPPDVVDPKSWSFWKKVFHTFTIGLYGLTITLGTSIYTPGISAIAHQFHVSEEVALLGLALYTEGLALGPVIGAPLSEAFGRKGTYVITCLLFMIFIMASGLAQNIETIIICRFIAAVFGSPALAMAAGTVADIWDMQTSGGIASVLIVSTFFLGPSIGPLIGGYTFQSQHSWRWLMWAILIATTPVLVCLVVMKETSLKHIQQKRAKQFGLPRPPKAKPRDAIKMLVVVTLFRPLKMLVREPIVIAWALYNSFLFGVLFGFFGSYYFVFVSLYQFTLAQVGLAFLGILVGIVIGITIFIMFDKLVYQKRRVLFENRRPPPEERLFMCMVGAVLLPVSLFWFAWTARPEVHWLAPIAAGVPFGITMMCLFVGSITYMIDTYGPLYSASAMAANGLLRYTFATAFPLFTTQMYRRLGIPWATSLLGFVALGLLPIPFALYKFGHALRSRSIFVGTTG